MIPSLGLSQAYISQTIPFDVIVLLVRLGEIFSASQNVNIQIDNSAFKKLSDKITKLWKLQLGDHPLVDAVWDVGLVRLG